MNEDDDWEELDENAMEECMVLATQLCSKQPPPCSTAAGAQNSTQHLKKQNSKSFSEVDSGRRSDVINNGSLGNVHDSGVWSSRSSNWHPSTSNSSRSVHVPASRNCPNQSTASTSTAIQKKELPQSSYRSRFSDFSATTDNTSLHHGSLTRKPSSSGKGQVLLATSSKGSPSKVRSPVEFLAGNDGNEKNTQAKAQHEKKKLDEQIITMQGEISLLRSELKRKEAALEAERLDHCAAIEAAEKRGREKVAKQAAETDTKLKEKGALLDKLQGELHFKNREVEELLNRCRQLEHQPEASQTPGPPHKRPRTGRASTDSSILPRFDFDVQGSVKVRNIEVQTESLESQRTQRSRLDVAMPRGVACQRRSIAILLASCGQASTSLASSSTAPAACHGTSDRWSLPPEWLTLISQALRKKDSDVEQKLVTLAVERLLHTHSTLSDDDHSRGTHTSDDPTEWYESQVGPSIQILSHFKSSEELSALQAIIAHLPPLKLKDIVVNRRIRVKLLEAAEMISKNWKFHREKPQCEAQVRLLRECCESIESDKEAIILLRLVSALSHHYQLCFASDACLIGQLCKKN